MVSDTLTKKIDGYVAVQGLNPCFNGRWSRTFLILGIIIINAGLNPCFNGRWSRTKPGKTDMIMVMGLNPCFNGRWSRTRIMIMLSGLVQVLILVLMEDGLGLG